MNGHGPNRRGDDPAIKQISDDLADLTTQYRDHVASDSDTSFSALLRKNMSVLVGLAAQLLIGVWLVSGFVAGIEAKQEVTNLKLGYLEKRIEDWYSKGDAARDMALRDSADADMRRRLEALENNINGRSLR